MGKRIGIGLLGLGTVGTGVANILQNPLNRHPLVQEIDLIKIAVRDTKRERELNLSKSLLTTNAEAVINDPAVDVVVEVIGGIEPARSLIMKAIKAGKSVVTANKAVIARHGQEIADAANSAGVYVLIEAAVGGGIPIIEPLKQSLGGNKIRKVSGIINGTTNYILTRMKKEGSDYKDVLKDAQELGYAEADPAADIDGLDAADKIAILSGLAFGGKINRESIQVKGITNIQTLDVNYAQQLGYGIKLLAQAESLGDSENSMSSLPLSVSVQPTLVPQDHPLSGVNGVNNAILVEGDPIGEVMFYGPGAGSGPTASAVVADILNIAGISQLNQTANGKLDSLLAATSWRTCHVVKANEIIQKNYIRLNAIDSPGVIGHIGTIFGEYGVSIQSIIQFDAINQVAEIVVITHKVSQGQMNQALERIKKLSGIKGIAAQMGCL